MMSPSARAGSGGDTSAGGAPLTAGASSLPSAGAATGGTESETVAGAGGALGGVITPVAMRSLVDDMEANVSTILESDGRAGYWYTFNDGKGGTQLPAPFGPFVPDLSNGGYPGSTHARHTQGAGFTSYAGFGFDLNNHSGTRQVYDASAYTGVVLWTRGNVKLRALFATRATAPLNEGGTCTSNCNDSFGLDLAPSQEWIEQTVPFASLAQSGYPSAGPFDPQALLGIAFAVPPGNEFDVWVDEIGFY